MRAAVTLAVLTMVLAVGCLDDGSSEPEMIAVTVTQEAPASVAEPTPTWQQWLGEQVQKGKCGNPNNILMYRNVRKEPPYGADFFCRAPTPVPNVVATQVAATVAAIPTPTRQPRVTPRPTLAPVSTPTPAWQQTATPYPTPTFDEWLGREISTLRCEDYPGSRPTWENAKRSWPYKADLWCTNPKSTTQPTPTPKTIPPKVTPWTPPATPTIQEMAKWDLKTNYAWDRCWKAGGKFEIGNIRQSPDGSWRWQYRCNPPPEPEQRRQTEGIPLEDLLKCGFGIAGLFAGEWLSAITCLELLDN